MHAAVVYYSLEGNTRLAAQSLASRLGAELFEVETVKPYPTHGLAKFFHGGKDSTFGRLPQIKPLTMDPSSYDLVVLALPMWAGKVAAPINSFIKGRQFGNAKVAFVIASASGDATSCAKDLAGKLGRSVGNTAVLSLKDPAKMPREELGSQIDAFAKQLTSPAGGAF